MSEWVWVGNKGAIEMNEYAVERMLEVLQSLTYEVQLFREAYVANASPKLEPKDEPQTDCVDIYPLVIIKDRYTGVYSNGKYTAWNVYFEGIPREIDEDDVTCRNFWYSYDGIAGLGKTPNEAIEDLRKKLNAERNEK